MSLGFKGTAEGTINITGLNQVITLVIQPNCKKNWISLSTGRSYAVFSSILAHS